jgi:hypothetical protein
MRVPPRSSNPQRLGTAFDYLFRFELQRRNRRAEHGVWIAELAAKASGFRAADLNRFSDFDELYKHARRQRRESGRVLRDAKRDVAAYCRKRKPADDDRACLASHALRLAAMDEVYRAGIFSADLGQVDEVAAKELVELLGIVPFENFVSDARTMLNPGFGKASRIVRGADADLIVGDLLIDVKTTKDGCVEADEIDQLLGYSSSRGKRDWRIRTSRRSTGWGCITPVMPIFGHGTCQRSTTTGPSARWNNGSSKCPLGAARATTKSVSNERGKGFTNRNTGAGSQKVPEVVRKPCTRR